MLWNKKNIEIFCLVYEKRTQLVAANSRQGIHHTSVVFFARGFRYELYALLLY